MQETMKLGICCVYFYGEDGDWLLPLQLHFIAQTLDRYNYTVYAAANRLKPDLLKVLAGTPNIRIVDLPHCEERANSEHAFYLDKLLQSAYADGCSHLVALDSDSFPIKDNWPDILLNQMNGRIRFAAALRKENEDTHLPHPCGYFMTREFYGERQPELLPKKTGTPDKSFQDFIRTTGQRIDTGIGYGHALWRYNEQWLPLLRSNQVNPHFLMAGIYGDIFFHLGASSRQPTFHLDHKLRASLRLSSKLQRFPYLWRLGAILERIYLRETEASFKKIAEYLKHDPDSFLATLRGQHVNPKTDSN